MNKPKEKVTLLTDDTYQEPDSIKSILSILKNDEIEESDIKNIVLVLGNYRSGKTTFTRFIAEKNDKLISKELVPNSKEYVLEDVDHTILSKTVYPTLIEDEETDTPFYDCPSFGGHNDLSDLTSAYLIKRVTEHAEAVKFVFTLSYTSIQKSGNELDFILLIENAVDFLKDIENFENSILLVVTKVDNAYGSYELPDGYVFKMIDRRIIEIRTSLRKEYFKSSINFENAFKLLNIFQKKNGNEFKNLVLFRKPNEEGYIHEIDLMQNVKEKIKTVLHNTIRFSKVSYHDFGYPISAKVASFANDISAKIYKDALLKFTEMGVELKMFYENFETSSENDISQLADPLSLAHSLFSEIEAATVDLSEIDILLQKLMQALKKLKINISSKHFLSILNLIKVLKLLEKITNFRLGKRYQKSADNLSNFVKHLDNSKLIYNYFENLQQRLSEYDIQNNLGKYIDLDIDSIEKDVSENALLKLSDSKLHTFLDSVKLNPTGYDIDYNAIKNIEIDKTKRTSLKNILTRTLKQRLNVQFLPSKIVINGNLIKISEIDMKLFDNHPHFSLVIHSTNTVFIDKDINHKKIKNLAIMAPKWNVVGNRKIVLNGETGLPFLDRAQSGKKNGAEGTNGAKGNPGKNGKNFFGIGETFINPGGLHIFLNGGDGGTGQDGGNGAQGTIGESFEKSNIVGFASSFLAKVDILKFTYSILVSSNVWHMFPILETYSVKINGKYGSDGGQGGAGGVGGLGGSPGTAIILGLKEHPNIAITAKHGIGGLGGKGGFGGAKGENGEDCTVDCIWKECTFARYTKKGKQTKNGFNGSNGMQTSKIALLSPEDLIDVASTVNNYKLFLRDTFSTKDNVLERFYQKVENQTQSYTNVLGLFNELEGLENQFLKLRYNMDFIPFYKSLLKKIEWFATNTNATQSSVENKKVLNYLYSTTLSKISSVNNGKSVILVIDIKEYLDVISNHIHNLVATSNNVAVNQSLKKYQNNVEEKIKEMVSFVNSYLIPTIERGYNNIKHDIQQMKKQIDHMKADIQKNREKINQIEKKAKQTFIVKLIFSVLKLVCVFAGFINSILAVVGTVVSGALNVVENLFFEYPNIDVGASAFPSVFYEEPKKFAEKILGSLKFTSLQIMDKSKKIVGSYLTQFPEHQRLLEGTRNELTKYENQIKKLPEHNIKNKRIIVQISKKLKNFLKKEKNKLNKSVNSMAKSRKKSKSGSISALDAVLGFIKILGVIEDYDDIDNKWTGAENDLDKAEKNLNFFKKTLKNQVYDAVDDLQNKTRLIIKDVQSGRAIELKNWLMKTALKQTKQTMIELSKPFYQMPDNIREHFESIEDAFSQLISIYQKIENRHEEQALASLTADAASQTSLLIKFKDKDLLYAVNKMETLIKSNLILSQFEIAMASFRQYVFPFAELHLQQFQLPSDLLLSSSIQDMAAKTAAKVDALKMTLQKLDSTINEYEEFVYTNVVFNSKSNWIAPFYIWTKDEHSHSISKFLDGEQITLKADIRKGIDKNAIKFNQIGIYLKVNDEHFQNELDKELESYEVSLKHSGNNVYRCGNKFYKIMGKQVPITYSFENDKTGQPVQKNIVYDKLKKGNVILSPYTLWTLKLNHLSNSGFKTLEKYKNLINIELEGVGQYVSNDNNSYKICGSNLADYYEEEIGAEDIDLVNLDDVNTLDKKGIKRNLKAFKQGYNQNKINSRKTRDVNQYERSLFSSETKTVHQPSLFDNIFQWINGHVTTMFFPVQNLNYGSNYHVTASFKPESTFANPYKENTYAYYNTKVSSSVDAHGLLTLTDFAVRSFVTKKKYPHSAYETKLQAQSQKKRCAQNLAYQYYCNE